MAIQIFTRPTTIPIEIDGEEMFQFVISDESLQKLSRVEEEIRAAMAKAQENANSDKEEEMLELIKDTLRDCMDTLLGKGAYAKLYKVKPSINIVTLCFAQICAGIKQEMEAAFTDGVGEKYRSRMV